MLYQATKSLCLWAFKAPNEPPEPPAGSHASVQIYRASPRFLSYRLLGFWIAFAVVWIGLWVMLLAGLFEGEAAVIAVAIGLMLVVAIVQFVAYFVIRVEYDLRYYVVTDRSLRVRHGALIVKEQTISFANVQNIRVVQGPLQRLFRIWDLQVDTAGGGGAPAGQVGGHQVAMAGIENAHAVRDGMLKHLRLRSTDAGLGDDDDGRLAAGAGALASARGLALLEGLAASASGLRAAAEARARP